MCSDPRGHEQPRHRRPGVISAVLAVAAAAAFATPASGEETGHALFAPFTRLSAATSNDSRQTRTGSASVSFAAPDGFFVGYRDYTLGGYPISAIFGPTNNVANYGNEDDDQTHNEAEVAPLADNLNNDGPRFFIFVVDIDGDGNIADDELIGTFIDYGDLYSFDVFYDNIYVDRIYRFQSVELMKQHVLFASDGENPVGRGWRADAFLTNVYLGYGDEVRGAWEPSLENTRHSLPQWLAGAIGRTRASTYATFGLREIVIEDSFGFVGEGSLTGRAALTQTNDHFVFGPQIGLGAVAEVDMWRFEAVVLGLVGYGHTDLQQSSVFGQASVLGGTNPGLNIQSTTTDSSLREDHVGWHGETRLTASCQLTQRLRFDATWRWYATGPVYHATQSVVWAVPDFGNRLPENAAAYGNDWWLGMTYSY